MNLYDTDTRYQLCAALDCAPYANHSYNARRNAQLNLNSRTPYVTDSTLRYHHARVINSCETVNGCFFKLVESVALDGHNTRRGSRVVVFDLTGAAIYHPSLDECRATSKQAGKDYAAWFAAFDPVAHYAQLLESRAAQAAASAAQLQALAAQFHAAMQKENAQ